MSQQSIKRGKESDEELTSVQSYLNKEVYTVEGKYVGRVKEVMISFGDDEISGVGLVNVNRDFFKNSQRVGKVKFPFNWVRSVSDVVIVRPITEETLTTYNS